MLRATRPCHPAQPGYKRAALGGAALAGAAGLVGAGLGAAYAHRAMRRVMSTPPQNFDAMYTEDPEAEDPAATEAEATEAEAAKPKKGIDCRAALGDAASVHDGSEFFVCLRHMLYSSRPLYAHCTDPNWRDDGVITKVTKGLAERKRKDKLKALSWLSVLLRLRCARPFRTKLRKYIHAGVLAIMIQMSSETAAKMPKKENETESPALVEPVVVEPVVVEPETPEDELSDSPWVKRIALKAGNLKKAARALAAKVDESETVAKMRLAGRAVEAIASSVVDEARALVQDALVDKFAEIVELRHLEVSMCATGVHIDDARPFRDEAVTKLSAFFGSSGSSPDVPKMMKLARMYGALFVSPSALLKYMPPLPAPARGLPDTASKLESALLTWIGRRISSDLDLDAAWKVRDLLFATMRVHYVGYEPEWWGWQFARCVHDHAEVKDAASLGCVQRLISALTKSPYSEEEPAAPKPKREAQRVAPYKGELASLYAAALGGDTDALKLLRALPPKDQDSKDSDSDSDSGRADVQKHAVSVSQSPVAGPEHAMCVGLLKQWGVEVEVPKINENSIASVFYGSGKVTPALKELAREAISEGEYHAIEELRLVLDPEQSTLVPIPKPALRMLRGFIKTSHAIGGLGTSLLSSQDVDINGDVDLAKLISEGETRHSAQGAAHVLLRRVEELLFAMRQLELLAQQLFPSSTALTWLSTDEYLRSLAYGIRIANKNYTPKMAKGKWTIDVGGTKSACEYVRDNIVKIGEDKTPVSTPSFAQWTRGMEIAQDLALIALAAWET